MNLAFRILGWIALLGLAAGLTRPNIFKKILKKRTSRGTVSLCFGLLFILFIFLYNLTIPNQKNAINEAAIGALAFLLLFSLIGLVVGLIKPTVFKNVLKKRTNRKFVGLYFTAAIILFIALISIVPSDQNKTELIQTTIKASTPAPVLVPSPYVDPYFAGYDKHSASQTFTSISADWTVPSIVPPYASHIESTAAWIGIGPFNAPEGHGLIQIGTDSTTGPASGVPSAVYDVFWECIPAPGNHIDSMSVNPNDQIRASINKVNDQWALSITDITNGQSFKQTVPCNADATDAQWILENVYATASVNLTPVMPRLGDFTFSSLKANGAALTSGDVRVIRMERDSQKLATPSALINNGSSFTFSNVGQ